MYGAIFGDVIGSRFEFDRGRRTKDFELFTSRNNFTDDTAMTIAIGDGLLNAGIDADINTIKSEIIESMQDWGHRYPSAGYGGRFYRWLFHDKLPKPYGSWGNGSVMRVSAVGWLYNSLERTREVARATAEVTHNHPEGVKGAECTAAVIYLARTGATKEEINDYVIKEFGYDCSETLDEMRKRHEHVESCMDSLPKALRSFFDGDSYEDVVRNAVSLGGDTDTLAAIAGAMAEAMYGMPIEILIAGKEYLPDDMINILDRFDKAIGRRGDETDPYENNKYIKMAVDMVRKSSEKEAFMVLLNVLRVRLAEIGEAPTPMVDKNGVMNAIDLSSLVMGKEFRLEEDFRLTIDKIKDSDGNIWVPLYTDNDEIDKGNTPNIRINMAIEVLLDEAVRYEASQGLVINPFGDTITIPKEIVKLLLEEYRNQEKNS